MHTVYYTPIFSAIYDKAAKAMYEAGLAFDGTMNELEAWLKANDPEAFLASLEGVPSTKRRSRKVVWIPYVA